MIVLFVIGLVVFGFGCARALRGATTEPQGVTMADMAEARRRSGSLMLQGIFCMVVGGFVAGSLFGPLIS